MSENRHSILIERWNPVEQSFKVYTYPVQFLPRTGENLKIDGRYYKVIKVVHDLGRDVITVRTELL